MSARDLDAKMSRRRIELQLHWREVAQRASMDPGNLRRIRLGEIKLTELAARGIDQAFEWEAGTAMATYLMAPGELVPGSNEWWEDIARRTVRLPPGERARVVDAIKQALTQSEKSVP